MTRPQRLFVVVTLAVFLFLLHEIGMDYYERQEDPSLNVILLFRLRLADFGLLALWTVSGLWVLRDW